MKKMRSPWNHHSFLAVNSDPFDLDGVFNSFNDDENTSPFEIGAEKDEDIKDFLMTNLKKEVPNKEKDFLSQETMKTEKKKSGNKHTSRCGGGKRKKTEEDEDEKKKKEMRKEDTDFKQIKKNIEEMEMKNSDMDLLAKHLDENTQGTLKTAKKLINENLPKIHETFQVIYEYALTLKKMLKSIPYRKNEEVMKS